MKVKEVQTLIAKIEVVEKDLRAMAVEAEPHLDTTPAYYAVIYLRAYQELLLKLMENVEVPEI